jgi:glycosyltransferase involved in cell wall biosynthesis
MISVIIPCYNSEKYLRECVESVLRQTYADLEIILVEDGSTDATSAICDEYASRDLRVTVLHKKNGGLSDARNAGIRLSKGEYIGFVDSDDWVEPDMFEALYNGLTLNDCDMSVCGFNEVFANKIISPADRQTDRQTDRHRSLFAMAEDSATMPGTSCINVA